MVVDIISNIAVDVQRKKVKNFNLRITPDCRVTLSVPLRTSDHQIEEFISSRKIWIENTLMKFRNSSDVRRWFGDGGQMSVLGDLYDVVEDVGKKPMCQISDGIAHLSFPEGYSYSQKEKFMIEWYRKILEGILPDLLSKWETSTGLHCNGYLTKIMKTKWGTCNHMTKIIWMNVRLAEKPLGCIEYVVLHELIHIAVPNHGWKFKNMLDRFMPDWKEKEEILNYGIISE